MNALVPVLLCLATGCVSGGFTPPWQKEQPKVAEPKDEIVPTGAAVERMPTDPVTQREYETAKRLFDEKKYAEAEKLFHKIVYAHAEPEWWQFGAGDSSDPDGGSDGEKKKKKSGRRGKGLNPVCEASLFYEAECQRLQKNYRTAVDTYTKLLVDFPRNQYTPATCVGLFEIADHYLEPTRRQMDEYQEQIQGKRTFVTPAIYVHFGDDMPLLDAEGHATIILNTIRLHDIKGELGRKALLYLGTISFFRHDYKEADFYFTQLHQEYPNDKDAPRAIKQSVICKQLMTGGSVYDLRGVEESKKLLLTNVGAYQELAKDKEWVEQQLTNINTQQADREFRIAEFYQRTGHPGSAYFYYELVCRRYPNSPYAEKAAKAKIEMKARVDKEHGGNGPAPAAPAAANPAFEAPTPIQAPPRTLPQGLEPRASGEHV
jgi:outer membrane protein assembly factor BamD (BamD/ComL family)